VLLALLNRPCSLCPGFAQSPPTREPQLFGTRALGRGCEKQAMAEDTGKSIRVALLLILNKMALSGLSPTPICAFQRPSFGNLYTCETVPLLSLPTPTTRATGSLLRAVGMALGAEPQSPVGIRRTGSFLSEHDRHVVRRRKLDTRS